MATWDLRLGIDTLGLSYNDYVFHSGTFCVFDNRDVNNSFYYQIIIKNSGIVPCGWNERI